jgi:hypothetical protein
VLFEYDANLMSVDRVWRHPSREREEYSLHYLHSDGSFQKFDTRAIEAEWRGSASRAIEAEWRASASKRSTYSWERDLHHWLVEHGAKTFVGAGWVDRISEEISNLLPRWRNELSGWPRE